MAFCSSVLSVKGVAIAMIASMAKSAAAARYRGGLGLDPVAPGGLGPALGLPVDLDVDPLVEEAKPPGDPVHGWERVFVVPDQVLHALAARQAHGVVARDSLVRAARRGVRGLELDPDVLARQVPADGEVRLEQRHGLA